MNVLRILFLVYLSLLSFNLNSIYSQGLDPSGFIEVKDYSFQLHGSDPISLARAFKESETYLEKLPTNFKFNIREKTYSKNDFLKSIRLLRTILKEPSKKKKDRKFKESFFLLETKSTREAGKVTGYYEVDIIAMKKPSGDFIFPILETPDDLHIQGEGKNRKVGKLTNGNLKPYQKRYELMKTDSLVKKRKIIAYVKLVDLHLAQLEGSAIINIAKSAPFRITYDSDNGHEYLSPSTYLKGVCKSLIPSNLRECILDFPEKVKSAILKNPRYVFFKRETTAPRGSGGIELIAERSVAMDQGFPLGIPLLLSFDSPPRSERNRIVFNHDRGSQIKGHGRLDYFLGSGIESEDLAGTINTEGRLILILPKI